MWYGSFPGLAVLPVAPAYGQNKKSLQSLLPPQAHSSELKIC